jgi:hypothetical protein
MAIPKRKFCPQGHDKETVGVLGTQCRECRREYQKEYNKRPVQKQAVKKWADANKDHIKDMEYRRTYGITLDDYKVMVAQQEGCCKICNEHKSLVVDHCHKTGAVRGLLCSQCNRAMGLFQDDPNRLQSAVAYLS